MSKCLVKPQRQRKTLTLNLFGSILIHGLVALVLSRYRSPELPQTEKPIEIIIVEQPTEQSPENISNSQPQPLSKTTPTPSPQAKPPSVSNPTTSVPQAITSPSPRKQLRAKIEPTPPVNKVNHKPDRPLPTPTETLVKSLPISPQPQINSDVEQPDDRNRVEESKQAELLTKPGINRDELHGSSHNQKPIIPRIERPVKPPKSQPETNSASTGNNNSDRELPAFTDRHESNQPKPLPIDTSSSTTTDIENSSVEEQQSEGKDINPTTDENDPTAANTVEEEQNEGKNINPTTDENNSTAANTVSDEPQPPLSISCKKNCQPKYPSVLNGAEGSAGIQLTINADGLVINADIASSNGNSKLDREALKAARKMEFSSIDRDRATVRINISFTVDGSDFERQARKEKKARARKEQERQAELERERQRLEQERKQAELERKQQENRQEQPEPTDLREQERWRKFRESRENYQ